MMFIKKFQPQQSALLWLFSYYLLCDNMELNKPVNRDLWRRKDLDETMDCAYRVTRLPDEKDC